MSLQPASTTDIMVLPPGSNVARRKNHIFIHTPERPDFVWGNYLLLLSSPPIQHIPELLQLWRSEFAALPEVDTVAIDWELALTPANDQLPYADSALPRSFDLTAGTVMQAQAGSMRGRDTALYLAIHPVEGDGPWSEVESLWVGNLDDGSTESADFLRWRLKSYRSLIDAGRGQWWGAWSDAALCGTGGLFWRDGVGSFQDVVTDAPYRNRGVASQLCSRMASAFFESATSGDLVVVAERDSVAERVYTGLGFRPAALQWGLVGPRTNLPK